MSGNPYLFMLAKTMRSRPLMFNQSAHMLLAARSGHFHKPDAKIPKPYQHTRKIYLEDVNTNLYHDFAPEYHMHLHSPIIQNGKRGVALVFLYVLLVVFPIWCLGSYLNKKWGSVLNPSLRPGKDHAHMAPRLIDFLKKNNYENKQDSLGRRTAQFYRNYNRQVLDYEFKPDVVKRLEGHGFKF